MISNRSGNKNIMGGMNHRHALYSLLLLFFIMIKELYEKNTEKNMIMSITKNNKNYESITKTRTALKSTLGGA